MTQFALAGWGLAAVRLFAILRVQPHWRAAVGPWWGLIAAALAVVLAPLAAADFAPTGDLGGVPWIGLAALEFGVGSAIGLVVALPGHALIGASSVSAVALGLRGAGSRVLVGLTLALVAASALTLGLHRPLIAAAAATTQLWPLADPGAWMWPAADLVAELALAAHALTVLALSLATPVLLSVAVIDLALRLAGRGPSPSGAMTEAMLPWARTAGALLALAASWSAYPEAWARGLG